ncbi:MAG: SxtJ family membrane protein [Saprospiraceae bacterium]
MKINEAYKSIFVIVAGFLLLYFVFRKEALLYVAAVIGIAGVASPVLRDLILKVWFQLAEVLGWINSRILLSLIFFLVLTPIALLHRIFSSNPLQLKNDSDSTFVDKNHRFNKEDLENLW